MITHPCKNVSYEGSFETLKLRDLNKVNRYKMNMEVINDDLMAK